jgi:hypothetical protein
VKTDGRRTPKINPEDLDPRYGFGEGEAFGEALGEAADAAEPLDFFAPIGPSFTILASSVPSAFLQYEPLASSFSVMSCIVALFAPLVMEVWSVTVKVRDCFLPAIVNVFAF